MINLLDYRPKEQFFWLRLGRKCCIIRPAAGHDEDSAIIIANAPCLVDSLQDRVTATDVHVYITATQTLNIYIPRRFVHKVTGEEIVLPLGYELGFEDGIAPKDIALVTGIPNPLIVEAVNVPLMLGSHFEITCTIDPRRSIFSSPDLLDLWLGLPTQTAEDFDMLPYVTPILPDLLQV